MKKLYTVLFAAMMTLCANAGLYMSGNFNSWNHCSPDYEFKATGTDDVYSLKVEKLYGEFLICSGTANKPSWTDLRFGGNGSKVVAGTEYKSVVNGDKNFTMDGTVENAIVTLNTKTGALLVEGASQDNSFTVVYLIGDIDDAGWDETTTDYPLESKGNNTYVGDITVSSLSYVKPRCGNQILSASGEDIVPEMGKAYTLGAGDKAIALSAGKYTVTVVADQKAESCTITFTTDGVVTPPDPTPEYPEHIYLIGYINGKDFTDTDKVEEAATSEDGVYTWEDVTIGDASAGTGTEAVGYISFVTAKGTTTGDWDTVNGSDRYGAPTDDTPLAIGAPAKVKLYPVNVSASSAASWKVAEGCYNIVLNLKDMKVSLTKGVSGIESIEAADAVAPVYYNLQGVRVDNPENGIFIEVRGHKAVKVVK